MNQTSTGTQELLKFLLGGSAIGAISLIGTFANSLFQKNIAALKQCNKNLRLDKERLRADVKKLQEDKKKAEDEVAYLVTQLVSLQESDLSPKDAGTLKLILGGFQKIKSLQEGLESCKAAARWLDSHKNEWAKIAARDAIRKHSKFIPRKQRRRFEEDIINYLNWVYTSLYIYGHARVPLTKFVESPTIHSSFPYIAAIKYIRNNGDRELLTIWTLDKVWTLA